MNPFEAAATDLERLANDLESIMSDILEHICADAVEWLKKEWPRKTGYSGDGWRYLLFGDTWTIYDIADYSSFVHRKGDRTKTPIYIEMVAEAVTQAARRLNVELMLTDRTKPYISKGWKLSPTNALWLELTGRVAPGYADSRPVIKTTNLPGAQGGARAIR